MFVLICTLPVGVTWVTQCIFIAVISTGFLSANVRMVLFSICLFICCSSISSDNMLISASGTLCWDDWDDVVQRSSTSSDVNKTYLSSSWCGCAKTSEKTYLSLVECYKIVFGFYHLNFEDFFDIATIRSTRANHQYKLYFKPARLNCYKNSFFIRIVKLWNELPGDIVEADSFQHFKSKLKSYLDIWL